MDLREFACPQYPQKHGLILNSVGPHPPQYYKPIQYILVPPPHSTIAIVFEVQVIYDRRRNEQWWCISCKGGIDEKTDKRVAHIARRAWLVEEKVTTTF